ncbi:hypothetical protein SLS53_001601 [Cytospora paraplurivora]|uniref:Uncharacterized protein n=1 Tax=Cytospora paraplurivora TaxID=2898453 RepID=A0AAN9YJF5_9PEZI
MTSSAGIGRELSQTEKDAMAFHFGKLFVTLTYGSPIAFVTAIGLLKRTNKEYGFPFYTPKQPKFNPNKFPGLREGSTSRIVWNATRGFAWYAASKVVVSLFLTSYAISVYAANLRGDPRLEPYRQDLQRRANHSGRIEQQSAVAQHHPELPEEPSFNYEGNPAPASTRSPTSWASPERSTKDPTSTWRPAQPLQPEPAQEPPIEETSIFDDASPVAPAEQQGAASRQSAQHGDSAWERVRNQAQPSRAQTSSWKKRREDEVSSRGVEQGSTSYSFTSADEERSYAKEQAQKEFDNMLEEERRGKSSASARR